MKKFEVGQKYNFICWFTGGNTLYTVEYRTQTKVSFKTVANEMDGVHEGIEEFEIDVDEFGNESILIYEYHGHKAQIYAE